MRFKAIAGLIVCVALNGCATYPQNPEDQATYYVSEARSSMSKDNCIGAANFIEAALGRPSGNAKVKELLKGSDKGRDCFYGHLETSISRVTSASTAAGALKQIEAANNADVFTPQQIGNLHLKLTAKVIDGNTVGTIPFDLGDNIDQFPELLLPANHKKIVERTITNLQGRGTALRSIGPLMAYARNGRPVLGDWKQALAGTGSVQESATWKEIEALLPTFHIRGDELEPVAKVYPRFAAQRKEEVITRIQFQLKNGDRLLQEDIQQALRSGIRGVEWVLSSGPKTTILTVERVRNDEKRIAERTQTITYARAEVNIVSALLLMPNNASYLYEIVSGGAEIEYGYVVSAVTDGKVVFDEVIRGKVGGEYRRCQNDRIQNVFGGVSSAGFVANEDMQRRCSGPSNVSIEELRRDIFSKIVDGVLKVPTIKIAHEMN